MVPRRQAPPPPSPLSAGDRWGWPHLLAALVVSILSLEAPLINWTLGSAEQKS